LKKYAFVSFNKCPDSPSLPYEWAHKEPAGSATVRECQRDITELG